MFERKYFVYKNRRICFYIQGGSAAGFHLLNEESSKYFNQMICLGGTPNRFHTYQTGDHRCLMEHFWKTRNNKTRQPKEKELINYIQNVDDNLIRNFLHETFSKKYSPWNPIIESNIGEKITQTIDNQTNDIFLLNF